MMYTMLSLVALLRGCPVWAALLCVAVAFAPAAKLHLHEVDIPPAPTGLLASLNNLGDGHSHEVDIHRAGHTTHGDHHDGTATELDASPKVLLKKVVSVLTFAVLVIAAIAVFAPVGLPSFSAHLLGARSPPERYHLVQPVRAPPAR